MTVVQLIARPVPDRFIDICIVDIVDSLESRMSAMLYPFSVPHTQNTWDDSPGSSSGPRYQLSSAVYSMDKIIVHIASTIEVTPALFLEVPDSLLFWMFPETSCDGCQCLRPAVIIHRWSASVSLSQISIAHSSLLSSVASRSLSFVKHSANIHNLLQFLYWRSNWASYLKSQGMNCIDISIDKYFWLILSVKHFPYFLCLGLSFLSLGLWEPRTGLCDHISGISLLTYHKCISRVS